MKRLLIIVYYWPPTGGSGVQRWLKFTKHLRSFGWEPVIYTPENPYVQERDETLLKDIPEDVEIIRHPVFEISKYFGTTNPNVNNADKTRRSIFATIKKYVGNYVRANLFIPDPRILWVRPSVRFLLRYLKSNNIDAVVSTGPPHSVHLIAYALSTKLGIPWMADFRDPWLEILNFHGFNTSASAYRKYKRIYEKVIQQADVAVVAQGTVQRNFQQHTPKPVTLITNGYDVDDMHTDDSAKLDTSKFNLVFVGIFYAMRNPPAFWQAVRELMDENELFAAKCRIVFVGKGQNDVMRDLVKYNLVSYCHFTGYVKHATAISYQMQAAGLLLFTGIEAEFRHDIPGKLFEYLAAQRHIICVAQPGNDAAEIVLKTESGYVVAHEDKQAMKAALLDLFAKYQEGNLAVTSKEYEQYERKKLTQKLASELNRITSTFK